MAIRQGKLSRNAILSVGFFRNALWVGIVVAGSPNVFISSSRNPSFLQGTRIG